MSTRKLIAVALVCGLLILLAGGIMLIQLGRDTKSAVPAAAGSWQDVGDVRARVVSASAESGAARVAVELEAGSAGIDAAGAGWTAIATTDRVEEVPAVDAGPTACGTRPVAPGATLACDVAFGPVAVGTNLVVVLRQGADLARWSVPLG